MSALRWFVPFLLLPALTFAQAASQPASQPATNPIWSWLQANWYLVLITVLIPSIINGMKAKSVREGVVGFLSSVLDRLSVTTNKDAPGTFKLPGKKS